MPKAQSNIQPQAHIFYYFQCGTQAFSPLIITSSSEYTTHQFLIYSILFFQQSLGLRLGMTTEQDRAKGKGLRLRPTWFCLHLRSTLLDGENFLTSSPPLGTLRSPAPPFKNLHINLLHNYYIIF